MLPRAGLASSGSFSDEGKRCSCGGNWPCFPHCMETEVRANFMLLHPLLRPLFPWRMAAAHPQMRRQEVFAQEEQ